MGIEIKVVNRLQWPTELKTATVECAGPAFVDYAASNALPRDLLLENLRKAMSQTDEASVKESGSDAEDDGSPKKKGKKKKKQINLFDLDEDELKKVSYYDILYIPMTADSDAVKRSYHKACLKYHPDKSGRGEEDVVFLAVKAAFDTLCDGEKRRSYDSTVDFDDSIPAGGEPAKKFYKVYGPVFERNLRFAVREKPKSEGGNNKKNKKKGSDFNTENPLEGIISCPPFGDDNTPIEQVQSFYDYWTHFNSWRDFSLKAQEITKHNMDMADNRDEKRWMAKEVVRKMKNLKKQEVSRIALLVERAVATDPRLKRNRDEVRDSKEKAKKEREEKANREQKELKEKEENEKKEKEERESSLKETKAKEKVIQQKQKKELRKARQLVRRTLFKVFETEQKAAENNADSEPFWSGLEHMNDDMEFLCEKLTIQQMADLTTKLGASGAELPEELPEDMIDTIEDILQTTKGASEDEKAQQKAKRDEARKRAAVKAAQKKEEIAATNPWTKEELTTLSKSIRKYPAGGSNRWEAIALFINNSLSLSTPRTKEECIAQYNITMRTYKPTDAAATSAATEASEEGNAEDWTAELDAKLQEGLKKYPASLEKNERWASIATHTGKSKKECVQRFKTIREELKNKK